MSNKLRRNLLEAMHPEGWPVTLSIGVASCRASPDDFDTLLRQADELMYEVKRSGRDRILQARVLSRAVPAGCYDTSFASIPPRGVSR